MEPVEGTVGHPVGAEAQGDPPPEDPAERRVAPRPHLPEAVLVRAPGPAAPSDEVRLTRGDEPQGLRPAKHVLVRQLEVLDPVPDIGPRLPREDPLEGLEDDPDRGVADRMGRRLDPRPMGPGEEGRELLGRMDEDPAVPRASGVGLVEGGRVGPEGSIREDLDRPEAEPGVP